MHLIFIRHGDPDYEHDSLTEKGRREAALLAERIAGWKVTDFYVSPYGRAQETIRPALERLGREAQTMDWLHEFDYKVRHPKTGKDHGCWDWLPRDYFGEKKAFDRLAWENLGWARKAQIGRRYREACAAFDAALTKRPPSTTACPTTRRRTRASGATCSPSRKTRTGAHSCSSVTWAPCSC